MKTGFKSMTLALAASVFLVTLPAHAHRGWMLPSATVLSGDNPWVTVDAATSNDLFYFEHNPLRGAENVQIIDPNGAQARAENFATGKYRSTFDVNLKEKGTYKLVLVNESVNASYRDKGDLKRWRGSAAAFRKEVPADAVDLAVAENYSRMEVFVTSGKPNDTALKPTGKGLELAPITHPNDLVAGDAASFRFIIDGEPASGIKVTVIPAGIRYRDQLNELEFTTDQDGRFSVKWPGPGMYWMSASFPARIPAPVGAGEGVQGPQGMPGGVAAGGSAVLAGAAVGTPPVMPVTPGKRVSYSATLEVMPE